MNDKKQIKVVLIGALLILIVIAITFLRSSFGEKKSSATTSTSTKEDAKGQISVEELSKKMENPENLVIIDLRSSIEFKNDHLKDSQNLSVDSLASSQEPFYADKTYVFLDDGESNTAKELISTLLDKTNDKNIFYLTGGFSAWKNQSEPTISTGNPNSFSDQSKVTYISSEDLKKEIDNRPNDLYLIDLRKKESFLEGHLPGANNIFLDDLESRYKEIPLGKKIILYDKDGLWAFQGSVKLFDLGIFNVFSFSEGLDKWKEKGFPVVK